MEAIDTFLPKDQLFEDVKFFKFYNNLKRADVKPTENSYRLLIIDETENLILKFVDTNATHQNDGTSYGNFEDTNLEVNVSRETDCFSFGQSSFIFSLDNKDTLVQVELRDKIDQSRLRRIVTDFKQHTKQSTFNERTDSASALQYFQFYSYLSQQQNMMQDYVRTSTYQKAILSNCEDFRDKVVLDVGAGSGILSFFALQAGAKKVYAIEASSMARHAHLLVQTNNCSNKIKVLAGKLEEIDLPEPVDVIISEPMGYMLFNERMLETYLHAKKWFRNQEAGKMFPTRGDLHIAPFTDAHLYLEQANKANFWFSNDFHGVDLRALHSAATNEYFRQPIVDTFDIRICMAKTVRHVIDFQKAHETDLHCISIPLEFIANQTGYMHGLAFWFDVAFIGSQNTCWLSTAPNQPLTHWYQVRCLLNSPLFVNKMQTIYGSCILRSNKRQSYDVDIELFVKENGTRSSNTLDLKNPHFRYTGQTVLPPPGCNEISPSEQLWSTMSYDQVRNTTSIPSINQMSSSAYPGQDRLAHTPNSILSNKPLQHQQQQIPGNEQEFFEPYSNASTFLK